MFGPCSSSTAPSQVVPSFLACDKILGIMATCKCTGCPVPGCHGSLGRLCGWNVGRKKRGLKLCFWCVPLPEQETASAPLSEVQRPDLPLEARESREGLATCKCTGCPVLGCRGSPGRPCGWNVGRQKRALELCFWCVTFPQHETPSAPFSDIPRPDPLLEAGGSCEGLARPLWLWCSDGVSWMASTNAGFRIPRVRHATGPCWVTQLGDIKNHIAALQETSARWNWSLCYWSHEAMDAEIAGCGVEVVRASYFAIDPAYRAARADVFRLWVLYRHGGLWLDLRGALARDSQGLGLEAVVRHFDGTPPPLLLCYGGQHREKFGGRHGEIINGFLMSAPHLEIWKRALERTADMVGTYPARWRRCRKSGQATIVVDDSLQYFPVPVAMTGREGVLSLGPFSMTQVVYPYLEQRGIIDVCMPKSFRDFWRWNKLSPKNSTWAKAQGRCFYHASEHAQGHRHYSLLNTPIVSLGTASSFDHRDEATLLASESRARHPTAAEVTQRNA